MFRPGIACCLAALALAGGARADGPPDRCAREMAAVADMIGCYRRNADRAALPQPDCDPGSVRFVAAARGRMVLSYGEQTRYGTVSKGMMLEVGASNPVRAPVAGVVMFAGQYRTFGNVVILMARCDLQVILAGANELNVTPGQAVAPGQQLAAMGNEGLPRLLYVELLQAGRTINPGRLLSGP